LASPGAATETWALRLFRRSPLKQRKLAEIEAMLGPTEGLRCLDLGSDNGVVSLLLRRRGGHWASADLTEEAAASIRELVGEDVHRLSGAALPFRDGEFDRVVIVDMIEHVEDDAALIRECARVLRPAGRLVVNTPQLKPTWLRKVRHALGQTDEKHGHLRPGYTQELLRQLLAGLFALDSHKTYSRFFSEAVDAAVNFAVERLGKKGSAKGMVVTGRDVRKHARVFAAYAAIYPAVRAVCTLDALIPWASGYMLIASATRLPGASARERPDSEAAGPELADRRPHTVRV
jgi:SAM-dependent methyltransferase